MTQASLSDTELSATLRAEGQECALPTRQPSTDEGLRSPPIKIRRKSHRLALGESAGKAGGRSRSPLSPEPAAVAVGPVVAKGGTRPGSRDRTPEATASGTLVPSSPDPAHSVGVGSRGPGWPEPSAPRGVVSPPRGGRVWRGSPWDGWSAGPSHHHGWGEGFAGPYSQRGYPHGRWVDDPYPYPPPPHPGFRDGQTNPPPAAAFASQGELDRFEALERKVDSLASSFLSMTKSGDTDSTLSLKPRHSAPPSRSSSSLPLEGMTPPQERPGGSDPSGSSESEGEGGEDSPGLLSWDSVVGLIQGEHSDASSSDESGDDVSSRATNLVEGGKTTTRPKRLALYPAIKKDLRSFASAVLKPPTPLSSRVDADPLPGGVFLQSSRKGIVISPPAGLAKFHLAVMPDSTAVKLLPVGKTAYAKTKGSLSEEAMRRNECDARVGISSLSHALWCVQFAKDRVATFREEVEADEAMDPVYSALHYALSHLSTTMNRVEVLMANATLLRRDTHLAQMDPLVPADDRATLRASPFVHPSMFSVASRTLVKDLDTARSQKKSEDGVQALTNLAKAGVKAKSAPQGQDKGGKAGKGKRKPLQRKSAPSKEKEPTTTPSQSRPKKRKHSSFRPNQDGKGKG